MFRSEDGMRTKPVERYIKTELLGDDHYFANNKEDNDGGTLVHDDCLYIPVRYKLEDGSYAPEPVLSSYHIEGGFNLRFNEIVVCYLQPYMSSWSNDRTRAARWTPHWLWRFASFDYAITRQVGNGEVTEIAEYAGVLDMSAEYGTSNWSDGGLIATHGNTQYWIVQVLRDPEGNKHYHPLSEDPRLDADELPDQYMGRQILPQ